MFVGSECTSSANTEQLAVQSHAPHGSAHSPLFELVFFCESLIYCPRTNNNKGDNFTWIPSTKGFALSLGQCKEERVDSSANLATVATYHPF